MEDFLIRNPFVVGKYLLDRTFVIEKTIRNS